jgi:hypothetical protein
VGWAREERFVYFVTKSCGKQNLVKLLKKGFGIAIIYLFVVFGLFSKSWKENNKGKF